MPRPWRIRYAGAKYHLTARGNGRESVFVDTADYERTELLKEAIGPILKELGISGEDLKRHGLATGVEKMLAIELFCKFSSASQREITPLCGYKRESSVGRQRNALRERLKNDGKLFRRFELIEKRLGRVLEC